MAGRDFARHIVVSAGKWRIKIGLKELRAVLPHLAAFAKSLKAREDAVESSTLEDATAFLHYLDHNSTPEQALTTVFRIFEHDFLQHRDIHSLANELDPIQRATLLKLSGKYCGFLRSDQGRTQSGLLEAGQNGTASILAIFGGQGFTNNSALSELRRATEIYGSIITELVETAATLLGQLSTSAAARPYFGEGKLDLSTWLKEPALAPDVSRIAEAPISFPLIGLLSLVQYRIALKTTRSSPYFFRSALTAVTGHSQGVLIAAVISMSDTWDNFKQNASLAIELLFWIGLESQYAAPASYIPPNVQSLSQDRGEGRPSSMLSVRGLDAASIQRCVKDANNNLPEGQKIFVAIANSRSNFVVAGPPHSLLGLSENLKSIGVDADLDQSRIPYPARRPVIQLTFLPISAPFHTPYLDDACAKVLSHVQMQAWTLPEDPTKVIHTATGSAVDRDTIAEAVRMIMVQPVDWTSACLGMSASHIVDFGPGQCSSICRSALEGSGTTVVVLTEERKRTPNFHPHTTFYQLDTPAACLSWRDEYQPRLVANASTHRLVTKMTTQLGVPPVMVAGMTPTTVSPEFVSAILKAGYHAELAGGGYTSPRALEGAIRSITSELPINRGLTCNIIYVSPRQVSWQVPLIKSLISQGVRIHGLTIGGGVPSVEIATEWMRDLGLKHISFKPGSEASIKQVLEIADENPNFPIGLQWTGGRAGGHHSFEDFHNPMIKMYGAIRQRQNITLIAGGGFGDAESFVHYFTGQWAEVYGHPWMPFDGVLLGSRVMAAKEARTSDPVKELMALASGCSDEHWHHSYVRAVGGVLTVLSEMGQPIHVLANRAMALWQDMDATIFSLKDPAKRLKKLASQREDIISRLNEDYAKPWFATTGSVVGEIEDLTYSQTLERVVELMYVASEHRWIDESYQSFAKDWVQRIVQRLSPDWMGPLPDMSLPLEALSDFSLRVPTARTALLYPEDTAFFMNLCRRRGQKPVNFIPRLDADFETWFKKDSLWQSEDIRAVPGEDPQKVCIIYGPVAARYTKQANEPIAKMLNGMCSDLTAMLADRIETIELSASIDDTGFELESFSIERSHTFEKEDIQDNCDAFLESFIPTRIPWARVALLSPFVYRNGEVVGNPIRAAFRPQLHDQLIVSAPLLGAQSILLNPSSSREQPYRRFLKLEYDDTTGISLKLTAPSNNSNDVALNFEFSVEEEGGSFIIHEVTPDRDAKIRNFYSHVWNCDLQASGTDDFDKTFEENLTVSKEMVERYLSAVSGADSLPQGYNTRDGKAPIDICIVVAWQGLMSGLVAANSGGNLFQLLHRSASFEYQPGATPLSIGDSICMSSKVTAMTTISSGRSVSVKVDIIRNGHLLVVVRSDFFIRGSFANDDADYSHEQEPVMLVDVDSRKLEALLRSRKWLSLTQPSMTIQGLQLKFCLTTIARKKRLETAGTLTATRTGKAEAQIGTVRFECEMAQKNPVMDFLRRHGRPQRQLTPLEQPGWRQEEPLTVRIPKSGDRYSKASKDTNPIHTCPYFAGFAGLDKPIAHGMSTSALVRGLVERSAADGDYTRFSRWSCSFDAKVLHGQTLEVKIEHVAMCAGRMILLVKAFEADSQEQVLHAEAEIEQAPSAYIFCGQGAQEKDMGMSLYHSDRAAREIWDRGNNHLQQIYGFSLIDIVRNDPKQITIHFGGKRGRAIRQNYLSITRNVTRNGRAFSEPILLGLNADSTSYTFTDARGLLFSTQFAQPALTLMEVAEKKSLEARGCVQQSTLFAGHSLGEYSALAACTSFMTLEDLLELVFYRGLIMQRAIERNENGQTDFSMMAVDPSRIAPSFGEDSFKQLVEQICVQTGLVLEIVNWNVEGRQYVCAGSLRALLLLGKVSDYISSTTTTGNNDDQSLKAVVERLAPSCLRQHGQISLSKGVATTPLTGIDVPFHSTVLREGIDGYRAYLKEKIVVEDVKPAQFLQKWIPNVVGKPFSLDRGYIEEVQRVTNSEPLRLLLEGCA